MTDTYIPSPLDLEMNGSHKGTLTVNHADPIPSSVEKTADRLRKNNICIHLPSPINSLLINNSIPPSSVPLPGTIVNLEHDKVPSPTIPLNDKGSPESPKIAVPDNAIELNWCDWNDLMTYRNLFPYAQRKMLDLIETKKNNFAHGFDRGSYFENALPIIAGNYPRASTYVCCERKSCGKIFPCRLWTLCSKCAYRKASEAIAMYYDAYDESGFYHVTCSFDGDIPFGATNCMTARDYWESIGNSIKKLLAENLIDGAYFVHEMSIRSFLPLRVVPHTHAIVSCGSFPREVIKYLGELIADCPEIELTPSINVRLIDSRADMSSMLKYVTKATDLSTAYNSAITQLNECGEKPRDLNCEMKDFLDSFGAASGHFKKIVRIGNMMSQRNSFIGARGDERDRVFGRYLTDFKNAKKDAKSKTTIQTQP